MHDGIISRCIAIALTYLNNNIVLFSFELLFFIITNFFRFLFRNHSCSSFLCQPDTRFQRYSEGTSLHPRAGTNIRTSRLSTLSRRTIIAGIVGDCVRIQPLNWGQDTKQLLPLLRPPTVCKQIVNGKARIALAVIPFPAKNHCSRGD